MSVRSAAGAALGFTAAMTVALGSASAQTPLERGTYLMQSMVACGNCHTPKGPNGELPGKELAGGFVIEDVPFTAHVPNITPDKETGIGDWTDEQIITAIRDGKRPDGSIVRPPMPIEFYRGMSDDDAKAIVAYLRSIPAVKNEVPESEYRAPMPDGYGPPVANVAAPAPDDKLAYGEYLVGIAHCLECHTPLTENGHLDLANQMGAGGREFKGPWGVSVAANLTPNGISRYSDDELKAIIRTGTRPNGSKLFPPMAVPYYAHITDADIDAMVAYLRTLPPK